MSLWVNIFCACSKMNNLSACFLHWPHYFFFQGASLEEAASFGPWVIERSRLRQFLPQEGQCRADSSPHTSSQQSLEFIPSDTEEVSGAGVAAGAEIGGLDGESTRPGRSCKSCRGSLGVEEGRDCFIRHQVFAESHLDIRISYMYKYDKYSVLLLSILY